MRLASEWRESGSDTELPLEQLRWLVRLRTLAALVMVLVTAAGWLAGLIEQPVPVVGVAAGIGLHNLWRHREVRTVLPALAGAQYAARSARSVFTQMLLDLLFLTLAIYLAGGVTNPFAVCYAFPVAIGAMLLPRRTALVLASMGYSGYGLFALGELRGLLPHFRLHVGPGEPWREPVFVGSRVAAFGVMMYGTLYFVSEVTRRWRSAEARRREQARVVQSRERLARVGELAAGVAHAVRNPLHGLLNAVDLLGSHSGADPRNAETLALMEEALHRIEKMTRRLLVLTREVPLARVETDLEALVEEAVRLSSPNARGSAARVQIERGGAGTVAADPARLAEAIINVLDNALDACRAGGTVTVRTARLPDGSVMVEVRDTGPGIPEADLPKVFDPFFTTKPVGEGTGLGLSIVRRVAEEHGGAVAVERAPEGGTVVRIGLPRRSPTDAEDGGDVP